MTQVTEETMEVATSMVKRNHMGRQSDRLNRRGRGGSAHKNLVSSVKRLPLMQIGPRDTP